MTTYKVTFVNEELGLNKTIRIPDDQYIIHAANERGMNLPISCNAGACVTCAGKILKGEVRQDHNFLKPAELDAGFVLTCRAYAESNCTIQTHQEDDLLNL